MNFRDYATRIQAQAAAAAKKIPTFDDMAAKDDYIHTEEFKVRGQSSRGKRDPAVLLKSDSALLATAVDPDETSSISSWSLLDRPTIRSSPQLPPEQEVTRVKVETSSNQGPTSQRWIDTVPMSSNTSLSSEAPSTYPLESQRSLSSGLPVLSVVAKALEAKNDAKFPQVETAGSDENNSNAGSSDDDSTDSEDDDDDMNDPILTMIRKSKPTTKRAKPKGQQRRKDTKSQNEHSLTKSKHRFLDEINEEEVPILSIDGMESGLPSSSTSLEPSSQGPTRTQGWFQSLASSSFNRLVARGQGQPSDVPLTTQKTAAPLARERMQKTSQVRYLADDYHQTEASAVLGDEELAQLSMMTNSNKNSCSAIGGFIAGHRRFAFIVFTLLLAWLVYYYQRSIDTVS